MQKAAAASLKPSAGSYRIALGDSFTGERATHVLTFDFKPVSIDAASVGELELRTDYTASLLLPQKRAPAPEETKEHVAGAVPCSAFNGSITRERELAGHCLLLFNPDTNSFTLERVANIVHLKQMVEENGSATPAGSSRKRRLHQPAQMVREARLVKKKVAAQPSVNAAAVAASAAVALPASHAASVPRPLVHVVTGAALGTSMQDLFDEEEDEAADAAESKQPLEATSATRAFPSALLPPPPPASLAAAAAAAPGAPIRSASKADFTWMSTAAPAAATTTPAAHLPQEHDLPAPAHSCAHCAQSIGASTSYSETGVSDVLHCDSCFEFWHKQCVQERADSAAAASSVQQPADGTWICCNCQQ